METWPGAEIWGNWCHLRIAESMGRKPAQHRAHEPLWKWDVVTFPHIHPSVCWAVLQQHCLHILRNSTFPKICYPDELPSSPRAHLCAQPWHRALTTGTPWARTQQVWGSRTSQAQRSVIHPTVGALLQTLIMTGISWHHYLLLLSVIFLQEKEKLPVLHSKGSNLCVWSLSVSTHDKRCTGFSTVLEGNVQHSKTPIFPSFLCTHLPTVWAQDILIPLEDHKFST